MSEQYQNRETVLFSWRSHFEWWVSSLAVWNLRSPQRGQEIYFLCLCRHQRLTDVR